jgi:hypothetical protein
MNKYAGIMGTEGRENRVQSGITQVRAISISVQAHTNKFEGINAKLEVKPS